MIFGRIRTTVYAVILLVIVIFCAYIFYIFYYHNPFRKPDVNVDTSQASVVKEIRALNRLETASFTIEKIVEAGQQGNAFQNLLYGDRILLIAHGNVIAGVDLAAISTDDVLINGEELTINLPAPDIFSSTLDNAQTRVYDRKLGYLSRANKDLESEARRAAETSIREAACNAGILGEARVNAIERVRQLFQFAGYLRVNVNIPPGTCQLVN